MIKIAFFDIDGTLLEMGHTEQWCFVMLGNW